MFFPLKKGGHRVMASGFLQRVQAALHHQEQLPNKHVIRKKTCLLLLTNIAESSLYYLL
jgi:hypothetical protein